MHKVIFSTITLFMLTAFAFGGTYSIDKAHSNVGFAVDHMVIATVDGKFNDFDVELTFDPNDLSTFNLKAIIKIASVDTDQEKRDNHLKSPDFFDAQTHPEMIFSSSKVEKKGNGYVAKGTLNIRGTQKEISLPFTVKGPIKDGWGNERIGVKAGVVVNRQDYGVKWSKSLDSGGLVVSDEVQVNINAEFILNK